MFKSVFVLSFFLLIGCSVTEPEMENLQSINSNSFLNNPFAFKLTIETFEAEKGEDYRKRSFIRTLSSDTGRKDTIYKYINKGNSFLFYKTQTGKSSFLTATIKYKKTYFTGNFRPGISRERLNRVFTDKTFARDTCKFDNEKRQAVFIFDDKNKLREVQLNNYYKR